MGVFNQVCCVSGLPITSGDKVRWFLVTESPYDDSLVCSSTDLFFPRTYPLLADYNWYGSIDGYDPNSPQIFGLKEQFKRDLKPLGVGDNQCHDVAAHKNMTFDEILRAVWERRILVSSSFDSFAEKENDFLSLLHSVNDEALRSDVAAASNLKPKAEEKQDVPSWLPTLENVSSILREAGYLVNLNVRDKAEGSRVLVDVRDYGWVRIRSAGFGPGIPLEPVVEVLGSHFAAMITAGTMSNYEPEIQVMPLPEQAERRNFLDSEDKEKFSKVYQAMVLEDVWQGIISLDPYYKKLRKKLQKEWETENRLPLSPIRDFVPFTMSVGQHHRYIKQGHPKTPFTSDQISEYLDNVAGMHSMLSILMPLGIPWRPSFCTGPQDAPYDLQEDWHYLLYSISHDLLERHDPDEENEENED